jgi:hypothetical protein
MLRALELHARAERRKVGRGHACACTWHSLLGLRGGPRGKWRRQSLQQRQAYLQRIHEQGFGCQPQESRHPPVLTIECNGRGCVGKSTNSIRERSLSNVSSKVHAEMGISTRASRTNKNWMGGCRAGDPRLLFPFSERLHITHGAC